MTCLNGKARTIRTRPFSERRALLEKLSAVVPAEAPLRISPQLEFSSWEALAEIRTTAREAQAEGSC